MFLVSGWPGDVSLLSKHYVKTPTPQQCERVSTSLAVRVVSVKALSPAPCLRTAPETLNRGIGLVKRPVILHEPERKQLLVQWLCLTHVKP